MKATLYTAGLQAEAQAAAMAAELIREEEEVTHGVQGGSAIITHIYSHPYLFSPAFAICSMPKKANRRKRRRAK